MLAFAARCVENSSSLEISAFERRTWDFFVKKIAWKFQETWRVCQLEANTRLANKNCLPVQVIMIWNPSSMEMFINAKVSSWQWKWQWQLCFSPQSCVWQWTTVQNVCLWTFCLQSFFLEKNALPVNFFKWRQRFWNVSSALATVHWPLLLLWS